MTYDLAIIGGGPAGVAAGVYAARKRLRTLFIVKEFGGQSNVSLDIQNWIGTVSISGPDLAANLEAHLRANTSDVLDIKTNELVQMVEGTTPNFKITTDKGAYETKTILVTAGASRRKLGAPGAEKFDGKGLTYCASCDGPLFAGMDVVVVGGGNAAFDDAIQLVAYCKSVTILNRTENFKADPATVEKVKTHPMIKILTNVEVAEVKGDTFVTSIVIRDAKTGTTSEMPTRGIFVEIGSLPNTSFLNGSAKKGLIKLDTYNRVVTDPKNQRTSAPGIWAAGDVTDGLFHQNNIAAGDAVKAIEDIYLELYKSA